MSFSTAVSREAVAGDGDNGAGRVQGAGRNESADGLAMLDRWRVQLRTLEEEHRRQLLKLQQLIAVQTSTAAVGPATSDATASKIPTAAAAAVAPGSPPRSIAAVLARRSLAAQLARAQRGASQPEAAAPHAPVAGEGLEALDGAATASGRSWVEQSTSPMRVAVAAVSEEWGVRTASGSGRRIRVRDDEAALVVVCDGSGHWRKVVSAEGAGRGGRGAEESWRTRPEDVSRASIATESPLPCEGSGAHAKTATRAPPLLSSSHRFQWVEPGAATTAAASAAAPPVTAPVAAEAQARPLDREAARAALTALFAARSERAAAVAAAVAAAAEAAVCGAGSSASTLAALRWQLQRQRESLQRQQTALREDTARRRDDEQCLRRVPHVA